MRIKKLVGQVVLTIVIIISTIFLCCYAPDKTVGDLKEIYTYQDSHFIKVDGLNVHYRKTGSGPVLLLLHGTGSSLHTWEEWTNLLKNDFTIISLDLPAYGLTGPNTNADYSIKGYVSFLNDFINELQLDSFYLAGNSLGGCIAWNYTYEFPEEVKKLVLLNATGYPSYKESSIVFKLARNDYANKIMLRFTPKFLVRKSLKEVFFNKNLVTDKMVNRYYDLQLREGNRQAFIDRAKTKYDVDPKAIQLIKQPTLVLWGKDDAWVPLVHAKRFKKDLKNAELIIYPKTGHVPMEEQPQKSAKDTKNFLLTD